MSLNVTENDWYCPHIARDNPEPDSDDVVPQTMAFNMGRFEEVIFPLCEKRLLLGTITEEAPE